MAQCVQQAVKLAWAPPPGRLRARGGGSGWGARAAQSLDSVGADGGRYSRLHQSTGLSAPKDTDALRPQAHRRRLATLLGPALGLCSRFLLAKDI